ncbi:MAG TPA: GNAT family N-acetyltransferase [Gemmatimonadales bacterium]|nr:GNAT family N-acetyltransferase [Gemmatimonadales bacterium]
MRTLARAGFRPAVATTIDELERLTPEWERLWRDCPSATPFQSPAWVIPWWRMFGRGSLRVAMLWSEERLAALAPLQADATVRLVGTGNSDHLDALCLPGAARELRDTLEELLAAEPRARGVDLVQLPPSSPLVELRLGSHSTTTPGEPCPVLPLPPDAAATLEDAVPPKVVRRVVAERRRAARRGPLRVEWAEGAPIETALAIFDDLVRLHSFAWAARGAPGLLADRHVVEFHRAVIRRAHPLGLVELCRLWIGDVPAAAYYGLRDQRRAYYYLGGFDPELGAVSPGTLVVAAAIESARHRRAEAFDFLRGQERYKYRWGAVDEPTVVLRSRR